MLALEKEFSTFQAEKVMYLTKLNQKNKIDINKETNVLSYYIISTEIYKRINVFLKYCKLYNDDYIKIKDENDFNFLKK